MQITKRTATVTTSDNRRDIFCFDDQRSEGEFVYFIQKYEDDRGYPQQVIIAIYHQPISITISLKTKEGEPK